RFASTSASARGLPRLSSGPMNLFKYVRGVRENVIATWPLDVDRDFFERRLLWLRALVVNEPSAVMNLLVDNATNNTKSEIMRRLLDPGQGRGLLTSDAETWRRHRRIMAPSFDRRS